MGFDLTTNFNEIASVWRDTEAAELRPNEASSMDEVDLAKLTEDLDTIAGYEQAHGSG